MLSTDKSVVENGGLLTVSVYKVVAGKAEPMSADDVTKAGLKLSLTRSEGTTADVTSVYPKISWSTLSNNHSDVKNVVINLLKDNKILDTTSVALGEKAVAQTEEWRLIPVMEKASIDYDIDKTQYSNYAENGKTSDDTIDKVFVKKGNISLQYEILHRKSNLMQIYSSMSDMPDDYCLAVTELNAKDAIIASYSSKDKNVGATNLRNSLMFSDSSSSAANVSYITVMLYDNNNNVIDRREVRTNLGTNGVFDMNKKFLAYIYYGTDGTGGAQYTNKRVTTMEGNFTTLTERVKDAEGNISKSSQKITETAEKYERVLKQVDEEKTNRENADRDIETSIEATASRIRTTVKSLYKEGNLLTGGDVKGSRAKRYQAYESPVTTHLRKGITYTVTARMWMEAKEGYPTQPKMDGHYITMFVYTKDWNTDSVWSDSYTYTKSGTVVDSFSFTPKSDIDVLVGIYEQISTGGPDPKEYGGVSVDWVRLDMGDMTGKNQITKWTPSAGDVETLNLIPDPNFEVASWETTDGASSRGTQGDANDVSFMSRYTDDYDDYGFRGVRMTRSGYTGKDANTYGLIYWIPFRGEGDYTAQVFIKDLDGVTFEDAVCIEVHPADVNKSRICYGFSIGMFKQTYETGYFRTSRTYHFGKTATNASTGEEQEIQWLEVRVFLTRNGDVVVSRLCLAKCGHAVHWNADALGSENGKMLSMESYAYQRADSIGAGIRQGLKSVGFRMDSATWSVKTCGNQFAWYATDADANGTDLSKAVMYMAQDNGTWTLHVKGYVEATGGKIGNLELVSDGGATFERSKDSSGKYIEKSRSVMSSRSITFYEQHSDGRFSIVDPVSWNIKNQSDADNPGKGLQSVKMEGYSYMIPGHSVELGDNTTPTNLAKMTGMGIGYSTNGRAIAKVFQSGTGGLAMVCVAYGRINADGTFDADKQTQLALDYNCTVERVNKRDTGWYECTLRQTPHGLYTVFVRARVSSGGNVMYATLGAVSVYTFTVMTSDDSTRNDCDFEYFVVSFGGY